MATDESATVIESLRAEIRSLLAEGNSVMARLAEAERLNVELVQRLQGVTLSTTEEAAPTETEPSTSTDDGAAPTKATLDKLNRTLNKVATSVSHLVVEQEERTRRLLELEERKIRLQVLKPKEIPNLDDKDPKKIPHWFELAYNQILRLKADPDDPDVQHDVFTRFTGNLGVWWNTVEKTNVGKTWREIRDVVYKHYGLWDMKDAARTALRNHASRRHTDYRSWDETFMTCLSQIKQAEGLSGAEPADSLGNCFILDMLPGS